MLNNERIKKAVCYLNFTKDIEVKGRKRTKKSLSYSNVTFTYPVFKRHEQI